LSQRRFTWNVVVDALELIRLQAAAWGLRLYAERLDALETFARLLSDYEEANVIGTHSVREVLLEHVLDSLSCLLFGPLGNARRLADVGSGGGLPGLPLKIVAPRLGVTLIEATGKKARFLRRAIETMSLGRVEVLNRRVEELGRKGDHRGVYDVTTARAVARLSVVAEYCVPLLRVGGHAISMKGRLEGEEVLAGERAAEILGAEVQEIIRVPRLPEIGEKQRSLVVLRKVGETPNRYPRSVGAPAKKPLGMV
jgi:16S rRNA (guanine527-N7)-methyltransferase